MSKMATEIRAFAERHNGAEGNEAIAVAVEAGAFLIYNAHELIEALEAAEKLDRTSDGRLIYPGMRIWRDSELIVTRVGSGFVTITDANGDDEVHPVHEFYSTEAAMLEAEALAASEERENGK